MTNNAADFDEARWRRLADADAAEESLSEADREFLDGFTPRSEAARAEAQLFAALARLGDDGQDEEAANSPLVNATVQHVLAARRRAEPQAPAPAARGARRRWAVTGLAAAAVVAAAWLGLVDREPAPEPPASQVAQAERTSEPATTPADAAVDAQTPEEPPVATPGFVVTSGTVLDADDTPRLAQAAATGALRVQSERACVGLHGTTACFEQGAQLEVEPDDPTRLVVVEGQGVVEAPATITGTCIVEIAGERYTIASPVTITTTAHGRKAARVEVLEGRVTLVDADGQTVALEAGDVRGRSKHASVQPPPDAKTLLAKARASRSAGDRAAAISHYEKLLRFHPEHPASHAAMVSLGDLYLDSREPAAALRWFQRYLDRDRGPLAQEAHIGTIRALGALGRDRQQQQAIEAFRERYPSSRYATQPGGTTPR